MLDVNWEEQRFNVKNNMHRWHVCVYIKPFFLPVDIQHSQCPWRFFNLRRDTSYVVTKLRHRDTALPRTWYAVNRVGNAMPCHHTGYDRHGIQTKGNKRRGSKNKDKTKEKKKKTKNGEKKKNK